MKRTYIIIPVALTFCFAGYAYWWSGARERRTAGDRNTAWQARNAAIDALYGGRTFVGRDGKKEALADISRGAAKLFFYGKTGADLAERTAILKERFGVTADPLAGCIVSEPLVTFADAYNAEVRQFIADRFGPTALADAEKEAFARWEKKRNP